MAVEALLLKLISPTGALIADYWNTTEVNDGLTFALKTAKIGGLLSWEVVLKNAISEPILTGSQFQFWIDGTHWFSGYCEEVPEVDTDSAELRITGLGYWKKLSSVLVNESYTAQTFAAIIADIGATYMGADLQVIYDALKVTAPTITGISIEFNDKSLDKVIADLLTIANSAYLTTQYVAYVDKDQDFNFGPLASATIRAYSEGYDYQSPEVDENQTKLVNKILAYRTSAVSSDTVEYVSAYSDLDSIDDWGEKAKKLTFPAYVDSSTIQKICDGIIEKYKDPTTRVVLKSLKAEAALDPGFYTAINKRRTFYRPATRFNSLDDWTTVTAPDTTITVDSTEVLAGRRSMKIVTTADSDGDYVETFPEQIVRAPTFFVLNFFKATAAAQFTVTLFDTFGNAVDIEIGKNNEPINEWLRYTVDIEIRYEVDSMEVASPLSTNVTLLEIHSPTATDSEELELRALTNVGILNLYKIRITMDTSSVTTSYFDAFSVEASSYKPHTLVMEEAQYNLGKSRLVDVTLGDQTDSLVKEINAESVAGQVALDVFAKQ